MPSGLLPDEKASHWHTCPAYIYATHRETERQRDREADREIDRGVGTQPRHAMRSAQCHLQARIQPRELGFSLLPLPAPARCPLLPQSRTGLQQPHRQRPKRRVHRPPRACPESISPPCQRKSARARERERVRERERESGGLIARQCGRGLESKS